jgi:thiamine kinase-like enzyme
MRQALIDMWKIPLPQPFKVGPLGQGAPCGYLWAENDVHCRLESVTELNAFINRCLNLRRSKAHTDAIDLGTSQLVICHGDLSERNLKMASNGNLYILDWAFAGVYPELFEHFALHYLSDSQGERLAQELISLPELSKRVNIEDITKLYEVYQALLTCDLV